MDGYIYLSMSVPLSAPGATVHVQDGVPTSYVHTNFNCTSGARRIRDLDKPNTLFYQVRLRMRMSSNGL